MMYYVYVLGSIKRKYLYVGLTNDVERRIRQHQMDKEKTTAPYRPFNVIRVEQYPDRPLAREREKYLKSGCGKEFLKTMIK